MAGFEKKPPAYQLPSYGGSTSKPPVYGANSPNPAVTGNVGVLKAAPNQKQFKNFRIPKQERY